MKYLGKLFFTTLLVMCIFSCQENSEKTDFDEKSEIPESKQLDTKTKAIVASDNYPYSIDSFEELDAYFRSIEADEPENLNLKSHALTGLFVQGLVQKFSDEEKLYYANAMANMRHALPNLTNFYELMQHLKKRMEVERLQNIAQKFYDKNMRMVESIEWRNTDIRKEKIITLNKLKEEFQLE